ncbi:His Kinase A (phospho-acceptor) domain-containing protein [Fibrobacter sp. UWR3]|uniref:sensor histidine kinase n=1 Tax=unclassified Fibrobacter TaxID=2634177 RepID=UPI000914F52B|nr:MULTISPECIES: HAMP domain-containing sensor histidine kinase [unclassified Fibrobacter]MBR4008679.1 HAMP domain-containing histidine kinase [Fibrobacter sp.]SHM17453.1 His Kinase A (phospho-acceptor) domain-containing protein [Fibrobacter sp. UWR3]
MLKNRLIKKRLVLIYSAIFAVIALPVAGLLYDSYLHMQDESKAEWAMHATQVLKMANNRIKDDLAIENKRSFMEYRFIKVAKTISAGEQPTYSDLALNFPVTSCNSDSSKLDYCSQYAGLIGHFQIDPDGVFSTPYLPAGALGQVQLENKDIRESFQNRLKFIVRDMGIKNKGTAATLDTSKTAGESSNALDQLANEVDLSKSKNRKKRMRVERTSEQEQFAFNVESAKMDTSGLYRIFPYVGTMDIAIESFQAELNRQYIVFYRNVLRGEENFVQGFVVDLREYLRSIVDLEVGDYANEDNHLALKFTYKGDLVSFGIDTRFAVKVFEENLAEPLNAITMSVYVDKSVQEAGGNGQIISNGQLLFLIGGIMFLLLGGGLISIYRLTQSQLDLAQKRQDFISAVSHELKTPLTTIKMRAEILQTSYQKMDDAKRKRSFDQIASESDRLTRLIQNVLDLSKIDGNRWVANIRKDWPKAVLDDFVTMYTKNIEDHGFSLTVSCDSDIDRVQLMMDRDAVMQILTNLVDNSLKFSKNADYKMIIIEMKTEGDHVYLAVRDYGPGIPPSEMKKVFQEFYRVENEMTRTTKGTGIGLSMVKKLCALSNMKIEIENANPGLRTKIHFPPMV